jgi:hypothetical protein
VGPARAAPTWDPRGKLPTEVRVGEAPRARRAEDNTTVYTGNLDETHYDIDEFKTSMCVNSGQVTLRAYVDSDQRLGVQLTAGNCWTYHWWSGVWNADSIRVTSMVNSTSANYFLAVKWNH